MYGIYVLYLSSPHRTRDSMCQTIERLSLTQHVNINSSYPPAPAHRMVFANLGSHEKDAFFGLLDELSVL